MAKDPNLPGGAEEIAARLEANAERDRKYNEAFRKRRNGNELTPTPAVLRKAPTTDHAGDLAKQAQASAADAYMARKANDEGKADKVAKAKTSAAKLVAMSGLDQ